MNGQMLTVSEAAVRLGISRNVAYGMVRAGRLPVVRLGFRPVLRVDSGILEEWVRTEARKNMVGAEV